MLTTNSAYENFRQNPTISNAPDFMKLKHGANTFYKWNDDHANWWRGIRNGNESCIMDLPVGMGCLAEPKAGKVSGHWLIDPNAEKNILNYLFYQDGLDTEKLGPLGSNKKFFPLENLPQPGGHQVVNGVEQHDKPSECWIHAGNPDIEAQSWGGSDGSGNGMPGGRYVITLRATDVNGNGAYTEWDVPVYLPWWSTRANTPLRWGNGCVN